MASTAMTANMVTRWRFLLTLMIPPIVEARAVARLTEYFPRSGALEAGETDLSVGSYPYCELPARRVGCSLSYVPQYTRNDGSVCWSCQKAAPGRS